MTAVLCSSRITPVESATQTSVVLVILKAIATDFAPPYVAAIGNVDYGNAIKIAWEAPRFWETEDHIYGGISWVKGLTALVWYPSDRFFAAKGILLGGYTTREELASKPLAEQFELSRAAIDALREKHPDRPLETNVEFWGAVVLELAEVPAAITPALFACARTAGWSAHIVEQKRTGRLIRPSARYVGPPAHSAATTTCPYDVSQALAARCPRGRPGGLPPGDRK